MIALWIALAAAGAAPPAAPLLAAPLPEAVLATQRGGFRLPSGIDVAITVQTQTVVDGAIVLRTVFRADQGPPSLTILAPKPGETVAAAPGQAPAAAGAGASAWSVTYDRSTGLQITPGVGGGPAVSVTAGDGPAAATPAGLVPVAAGATTDNGVIATGGSGGLRTVTLDGANLSIMHLAGNAFGSAIINSGNDRAIDTQTSVAIDLANAGPDVLGSAMFRVEDIALAATAMRAN